jgi:glycosyltransferase involved in cell wall biosynthesis
MIKTSIAIPVYNEARFIKRTLESVIGEADEVVISDNASNDGTSEIIQSYAAKYPMIKYFRQKGNIGSGRNSIFAQEHATGDYIRLLGGHDLISRGSTASMLNIILSDSDIVMVYPRHTIYLNSDYSVNNINAEPRWLEFECDLKSNSRDARIKASLEIASSFHATAWSLYRRDILFSMREKIAFTEDCFSDQGLVTYAASIGKVVGDDLSVFFWMLPRSGDFSDFNISGKRMSKMITGSSNIFYCRFIVVFEQYKTVKNLPASCEDAQKHFADFVLTNSVSNQFCGYTSRFTLDDMPSPNKENEEIRDEIVKEILEFQRKKFSEILPSSQHSLHTKKSKLKKLVKCLLPYGLIRIWQKLKYNI